MSLYQKASLVQIPSGYKAADDKLYSVVPNNGDGDFTVTVDADATRVNKDGLVETVAADQARLNYDPTNPQDPHLLLEPSRQNYTAYSAQFDNSYWSKATSDSTPNPTVTANAATSPDGGSNADRIQATAPPSSEWMQISRSGINPNATVGSKLQQSLYLKAYDSSQVGKKVDIYIYDFSNTNYGTVENYTLTANWQRVIVEHTISGSNTCTNLLFAFGKGRSTIGGSSQAEAATDFLVWGAQLEVSSYPTSYIPTSGSAVTRTVDKCFNGGDVNLFDLDELTFFIDVTPYEASAYYYASINDGSNQNRIIFIFNDNNTSFTSRIVSSGSLQVNDTENIAFKTRHKMAMSLKANDVKIYLNGNSIYTSSSFIMPVDLDRLNFSIYANSNNFFEGKIHQVMVFNEALSDSELQTLTS